MAADAIAGYLEYLQEDGLPLPVSDLAAVPPLVEQIRVRLRVDVRRRLPALRPRRS
jgi:hypothetical protein